MSAADQQQASRWLRRKNRMRLHLSGISTNNPNRRRRPARAPPSEPAARLLEMFAELVDARMESCVRMERLVRESGRVVTREQLMGEVWETEWYSSTKALDMHISVLRRKLGDDVADPRHIATVRGVGFRFDS